MHSFSQQRGSRSNNEKHEEIKTRRESHWFVVGSFYIFIGWKCCFNSIFFSANVHVCPFLPFLLLQLYFNYSSYMTTAGVNVTGVCPRGTCCVFQAFVDVLERLFASRRVLGRMLIRGVQLSNGSTSFNQLTTSGKPWFERRKDNTTTNAAAAVLHRCKCENTFNGNLLLLSAAPFRGAFKPVKVKELQGKVRLTHSLVAIALACAGRRTFLWQSPRFCWETAARTESSLSEVSISKVSVFTPTTREPSSCSRSGIN